MQRSTKFCFGSAFSALLASAAFAAGPPLNEPVDVTVTNAVIPVEVSNADPVPVEVVSLPLPVSELPANRYQKTVSVDEWNVTTPGNSLITISGSILGIPSDKILVLEFVSVQALVNSGDNVLADITCQGAGINIG